METVLPAAASSCERTSAFSLRRERGLLLTGPRAEEEEEEEGGSRVGIVTPKQSGNPVIISGTRGGEPGEGGSCESSRNKESKALSIRLSE